MRQLEAELAGAGAASAKPQPGMYTAPRRTTSTTPAQQSAKDVGGAAAAPPVSPALSYRHAMATSHLRSSLFSHPPPFSAPLQLVASLDALLHPQQPAATPGRSALTALRRSHTGELGAGGGPLPSQLSAAPSLGGSHAGTTAGEATPTLLPAPSNRWRLAAERAASFKTPAFGSAAAAAAASGNSAEGSGGTSWRQVSFAAAHGQASKASPAADLLADIEKVVSPGAGAPLAAASPSFSHQAAAAGPPQAAVRQQSWRLGGSLDSYSSPQPTARPQSSSIGSAGRHVATEAAASPGHGVAEGHSKAAAATAISAATALESATLPAVHLDVQLPAVADST